MKKLECLNIKFKIITIEFILYTLYKKSSIGNYEMSSYQSSNISLPWNPSKNDSDEPLRQDDGIRPYLPVKFLDLEDYVKKMQGLMWLSHEVDMSNDRNDWENSIGDGERQCLKLILSFFAIGDELVMENISENFMDEINIQEVRNVYIVQAFHELVHSESYSIQVQTLIPKEEREEVSNAIKTMPVIKRMALWVQKYMKPQVPLGVRIIAFALFEGVIFSGAFAMIQWFKEKNVLSGLTSYNEFISRDENLHCSFACHLFREYIINKPPQEYMYNIVEEVMEIKEEFINEAIPSALIGLNSNSLLQYVQSVADCVISTLGYEPLYNVENPFPFMEKLAMNDVMKTDFFSNQVSAYAKVPKNKISNMDDEEECPCIWDVNFEPLHHLPNVTPVI